MPELDRHQGTDHDATFAPRPGRRVRSVREPALSGDELIAFGLILLMVCGPLALGALGL